MRNLLEYKKNKIDLYELQEYLKIEEYPKLVTVVYELIEQRRLKGIKASGMNGKRPSLYNSYKIVREKESVPDYKEELLFLSPKLDNSYYLKHPEKYHVDRTFVQRLSQYFEKEYDKLAISESFNERSFEIFFREKYLIKEGGKTLLKNLGISLDELNLYETTEPIAYFSNYKTVPQTILFIENKDTFYSMRKYLLEGNETILGKRIGTIIYGAGKRVWSSLNDFNISVEPYMLHVDNEYLYFGDLDYEGLLIYEKLYELMKKERCVKPFVAAYQKMIEKTRNIPLPSTKEGQNRKIRGSFEDAFTKEAFVPMKKILEEEKYIPQESLVSADFSK